MDPKARAADSSKLTQVKQPTKAPKAMPSKFHPTGSRAVEPTSPMREPLTLAGNPPASPTKGGKAKSTLKKAGPGTNQSSEDQKENQANVSDHQSENVPNH